MELIQLIIEGRLSTWDGLCDSVEYGEELKQFADDPDQFDMLLKQLTMGRSSNIDFKELASVDGLNKRLRVVDGPVSDAILEYLTSAGVEMKDRGKQRLKNLRIAITNIKRSSIDTIRKCELVINAIKEAKLASHCIDTIRKCELVINAIKETQLASSSTFGQVEFCQFIADADGGCPGKLPIACCSPMFFKAYINVVNQHNKATTPSEWAHRLRISNDDLESTNKEKALAILAALSEVAFASFGPVAEHIGLHKKAGTLSPDFRQAGIYTNADYPLKDLVAVLQVYFDLVPKNLYVGDFKPRIRSDAAAADSSSWKESPVSIQGRLDALEAGGTLEELFKKLSLAQAKVRTGWKKWVQKADQSKLTTDVGRVSFLQDYIAYKEHTATNYKAWTNNLKYSSEALKRAFDCVLEQQVMTETNDLKSLFLFHGSSDGQKKN